MRKTSVAVLILLGTVSIALACGTASRKDAPDKVYDATRTALDLPGDKDTQYEQHEEGVVKITINQLRVLQETFEKYSLASEFEVYVDHSVIGGISKKEFDILKELPESKIIDRSTIIVPNGRNAGLSACNDIYSSTYEVSSTIEAEDIVMIDWALSVTDKTTEKMYEGGSVRILVTAGDIYEVKRIAHDDGWILFFVQADILKEPSASFYESLDAEPIKQIQIEIKQIEMSSEAYKTLGYAKEDASDAIAVTRPTQEEWGRLLAREDVEISARPKVTVLNEHEASIRIGSGASFVEHKVLPVIQEDNSLIADISISSSEIIRVLDDGQEVQSEWASNMRVRAMPGDELLIGTGFGKMDILWFFSYTFKIMN